MGTLERIGSGSGTRLLALLGCLALALTLGAAGMADAQKKGKKKKGPAVFNASQAVNVTVPDVPVAGASTPVVSTINVPKSFKGKVVGDLNITGLQTTGILAGAANDLVVLLTAPSGKTVQLFQNPGDTSLGPLTLDDDTLTLACDTAAPPCVDPDATLNRPFAGRANLMFLQNGDTGPLSAFDGAPMPGVWKITVFDEATAGVQSVFNAWGLQIKPASPPAGGKKGGSFAGTAAPNLAIPDAPAAGAATAVKSTITAGKQFKGRVVGDLDVTGIATTGSAAGAAGQVHLKLTAPNGRTVQLTSGHGDQSLGPWTLDDETSASICDSAAPPCPDPLQSLNRPFGGTSNVIGTGVGGVGPLSAFDGVPIKGTWTLSAFDDTNLLTSTLNTWGLKITAAKPPKTTGGKGKGKKATGAAKKKAKKTPKQFAQQLAVNLTVPQDAAAGASTPLISTITAPKKFKGLAVGDVDVTGITVTGSGAGSVDDLNVKLIAPNGNTARLFQDLGSDAIGPLTLDDDSPASVCDAAAVCTQPHRSLGRPFAGTANSLFLETAGTGPLSSFEGAPVRGAWRLHVIDDTGAATSSTFNSWGLRITVAKPVK